MVTARDPEGVDLEYGIGLDALVPDWQAEPVLTVRFTENHITDLLMLGLYVRSARGYHAMGGWDDKVTFVYRVLPKRDV